MSTALASARRRRAGPEPVISNTRQTAPQPSFPGTQQQQPGQPNMGVGLTLPQVIAVVDKRLMTLEAFMQTQKSISSTENPMMDNSVGEEYFRSIVEEYNSRFDIIADELATVKDLLMKLQSFTMDVNQKLVEERIRILSDAPTPLERALQSFDS
jgi:hypothetical protein